jgi:4-hydroxy-4-methyl-2-oxoglutarate aldolase
VSAPTPPLEPSVLEALVRYDTPTMSNAIETFDIRPRDVGFASIEIRCMFPELPPMVGYAATATIRARGVGQGNQSSDQSPLWAHVLSVPGPRVVVVQDLDDPPAHGSLWGEVNASVFTALGCLGAVTDGCVRDLNEARAMGFRFFARGAGVSHAYVRVERAGIPVSIGGLDVRPGDLIHADQHGVLLIPTEIARELPAAADKVIAREQEFIKWVRSPDFDPAKLAEMRRVRH